MSASKRNRNRRIDPQADRILTSDEVHTLAEAMEKVMTPEMRAMSEKFGLDLYSSLAFKQVARRCVRERERPRADIKDAAREMNVPQYRLKAIETSSQTNIDPAVLD